MVSKKCDKKMPEVRNSRQDGDTSKDNLATNCEPQQSLGFGVRLSGTNLQQFLHLQQRLQYGMKSKVIHEALKLANRFLDLKEAAEPTYNIPRELIENE